MKSYVFPGQGSQFVGMCNDLYQKYPSLKEMFKNAEDILGFNISDIMFNGTSEDLIQTKVTQSATRAENSPRECPATFLGLKESPNIFKMAIE